ncbi:hypothetical protein MGG_17326 [Pyricularia oryzae 70-15]|uniref:Uncharacterized protein n=4 Tax=Pyricularia oryzae TaxID=318829 RepID=G4NCU2_PYRO7|nr:uncharacterized protein MGG_17326 [Pyricularia oryzae 70-15]ELQ39469.1 hypothetical protein OOU_Y34scaffold00496g5 [Pyricularia oryzae Y34]KAI7915051.1 hypothetical protein M9X92_008649 [Pyricularia oryzae]EHA48335.1 hypothetical protein MGG_17326 [Pyricularia oryzae 70-15]KAI7916194.1 hypothetical protein M0657_008717 [Pyricularia oryzae]QBZ62158.1 hypothetical protein PoMZ_11034 [Pyricularia oryzae]
MTVGQYELVQKSCFGDGGGQDLLASECRTGQGQTAWAGKAGTHGLIVVHYW